MYLVLFVKILGLVNRLSLISRVISSDDFVFYVIRNYVEIIRFVQEIFVFTSFKYISRNNSCVSFRMIHFTINKTNVLLTVQRAYWIAHQQQGKC